MRILIVLPGALGDVIRGLPLLGRVRHGHPAAEIGWLVEPLSAPLLTGHPWLDRVHLFERRGGIAAVRRVARELAAARYDIALDLGRGAKSALFAFASRAPTRLGFDRTDAREAGWLFSTQRLPPQGGGRSKLEQFLAFGDLLGLPAVAPGFGLIPTDAERQEASQLLADLPRPIIAACVGSSCSSRRWFADRTAAVLDRLAERRGAGAVVLGTAADAGFALEVMRRTRARARDLVGRTTVRQLMAILAASDLAFGPDSGALHLAAAVGTPAVSLWGPTSASRSTPFGSAALALEARAPCAPCFLATCPIGRPCMETIAAATVVDKVTEGLAA